MEKGEREEFVSNFERGKKEGDLERGKEEEGKHPPLRKIISLFLLLSKK